MKPTLFLLIPLLSANILSAAPITKTPKTISDLGIDLVKVEDPGNPEDPATHCGAVLESFNISKYDITAEQWCALLNKVAKHSDPYLLYDERMSNDPNVASINRTGDATTGFSYQPKSAATAKLPMVYLNWFCAARYCNWMHNSAIAGHLLEGTEDASTTEKGAYDLTVPIQILTSKYVDFLNAVAATTDANNLHKKIYQDESSLLDTINCNKGEDGKYVYAAKQNDASTTPEYIAVSWSSAARFMNWRYNTEVTKNPHQYAPEEITEKGLFDITAGMKDITGDGEKKVSETGEAVAVVYVIPTDYAKLTPGAKFYLPSEDQWVKAAYFKRTKSASGIQIRLTGNEYSADYWLYPTSHDVTPANHLSKKMMEVKEAWWAVHEDASDRMAMQDSDNGNGVNYYVESDNNDEKFTTGTKQPRLTPVGYFSKTVSPYGVFDMAGNVSQWLGGTPAHNVTYPDGHTEWQYAGVTRPIRGGGWGKEGQCPTGAQQFAKDTVMVIDGSVRRDYIGFRIAAPL